MGKIHLVSINMGYGHQRTAYPLRDLARKERAIQANDYPDIPPKDRKIWEGSRKFYEFVSRLRGTPFIGKSVFSVYDKFQEILGFYPKQDLSKPNFLLKQTIALIKKGWGKDLIKRLSKNPLPLVTTFFIPAFMAEFFDYPNQIFCVICDTDISRSWAPLNPKSSRIKYFAPTQRAAERLRLYGVKPENIYFSGYPLPLENIGSSKMEVLKEDLKYRLLNLDPQKRYFQKYQMLVKKCLGELPRKPDHPLTILFSVGGAGAQKEIGIKALKGFIREVKKGEIKMILSAGIREKVRDYFLENIDKLGLKKNLNQSISVLYSQRIEDYFREFNQALRKTDLLWTKPSELSFYSALGIPILIAPPIGSQEEFNKRWLLNSGYGSFQKNPRYIRQWLLDWRKEGYLAEHAMEGFIEGEREAVTKIKDIISKCCGS